MTSSIWTAVGIISLVWGVLLIYMAFAKRRATIRDAVFASIDSVMEDHGPGRTSAEDIAEWLHRYALPCYTEAEMLPHVEAWMRCREWRFAE